MEVLERALSIVMNQGGGPVSILLIINIYVIWRLLKRFKSVEDGVAALKKEIADMEMLLIEKYVKWTTFHELSDKFNELKNEVSKILGRLDVKK
jgi:hypothetical protein